MTNQSPASHVNPLHPAMVQQPASPTHPRRKDRGGTPEGSADTPEGIPGADDAPAEEMENLTGSTPEGRPKPRTPPEGRKQQPAQRHNAPGKVKENLAGSTPEGRPTHHEPPRRGVSGSQRKSESDSTIEASDPDSKKSLHNRESPGRMTKRAR